MEVGKKPQFRDWRLASPEPGPWEHAITTYLPFVLTAATFLATFIFQWHQQDRQDAFQIQQQRLQQQAADEAAWRKALESVTTKDSPGAIVGAFQAKTFVDDGGPHSDQARSIALSLLPYMDDRVVHDDILFDLLGGVDQESQSHIIANDQTLTYKLREIYAGIEKKRRSPKGNSFGDFLQHLERYLDDRSDPQIVEEARTKIAELDSTSGALAGLWNPASPQKPRASPAGQDLSGVTFLSFGSQDFRGLDFSKAANMWGVAFYGNCKLSPTQVSPDVIVLNTLPNPADAAAGSRNP